MMMNAIGIDSKTIETTTESGNCRVMWRIKVRTVTFWSFCSFTPKRQYIIRVTFLHYSLIISITNPIIGSCGPVSFNFFFGCYDLQRTFLRGKLCIIHLLNLNGSFFGCSIVLQGMLHWDRALLKQQIHLSKAYTSYKRSTSAILRSHGFEPSITLIT